MRKYRCAFTIIVLILACWSCVNGNHSKYNPQQTSFDKLLANYDKQYFKQGNDIQKKEFIERFERDLSYYIDSVKLFVNWQGQIEYIKTREISDNYTIIEFTITYIPEQYRKVTFNCMYVAKTYNLKDDYIYNKVKAISNYSTVYFDGIIRTNNDGTVKYSSSNSNSYGLNISYPDYDFFIIDIGTTSRGDSLSVNLQNAIKCSYKLTEPLRLKDIKKINEKEQESRWKSLKYECEDEFIEKLTKQENDYLQRVNQSLMFNFLWSK